MKKTLGSVGIIALSLLAVAANAQTPQPATQPWDATKNPTVDSITAPYKSKLIAPRPALTTADIFPVIGKYESAVNTDAASVTITLDEQNKGLVWVEGLPQGKIKAMLRKGPATYKIPAQKLEDGKEVAEGTLIFDKETNTLSICIGKNYHAENPAAAFVPEEQPAEEVKPVAKTKTKKVAPAPKPWVYTGTKVETVTAMN
jgi:hypothetical protein